MKVSEIVEQYIQKRDHLSSVRSKFKEFEDGTKRELAELEAKILEVSNDTGVESFKTSYGTAFRTMKDYARISAGERETVDEYVLKSGNTQLFTSHISKVALKELMEGGTIPADIGIEYIQEDVIQVRKPTKRKS